MCFGTVLIIRLLFISASFKSSLLLVKNEFSKIPSSLSSTPTTTLYLSFNLSYSLLPILPYPKMHIESLQI